MRLDEVAERNAAEQTARNDEKDKIKSGEVWGQRANQNRKYKNGLYVFPMS